MPEYGYLPRRLRPVSCCSYQRDMHVGLNGIEISLSVRLDMGHLGNRTPLKDVRI